MSRGPGEAPPATGSMSGGRLDRIAGPLLGALFAAGMAAVALGSDPLSIDDARHWFTGVFFRDALLAFPWGGPQGWALAYYARFPALAPFHWPPLFHGLEAVAFLVLGVGPAGPALVLAGFNLLLVSYLHRWVLALTGSAARALGAVLLLVTTASVFLFARRTMLEIPGTCLALMSLVHVDAYLREGRRRDLVGAGIAFSLSLLTKETGVIVAPAAFLHAMATGRFRVLLRREVVVTALVALAPPAAYYLVAGNVVGSRVAAAVTLPDADSFAAYLSGALELASPGFWLLFLLACVSGVRRTTALPVWAAVLALAGGVTVRFLEPRYLFTAVPFAVVAAAQLRLPRLRGGFVAALLAGVILLQAVALVRAPLPRNRGMEAAARYVAANPLGTCLFISDRTFENFVIHARRLDPEFPLPILPAAKFLFYTTVDEESGDEVRRPLLTDPAEVEAFLKDYGVRLLLVDDGDARVESLGGEILDRLLRGPGFMEVASFPIEDGLRGNYSLRVYRFEGDGRFRRDNIELRMGRMRDRVIEVPAEALGISPVETPASGLGPGGGEE